MIGLMPSTAFWERVQLYCTFQAEVDGFLTKGHHFLDFPRKGLNFCPFEVSRQRVLIVMAFWASQKCLWLDLAAFPLKR